MSISNTNLQPFFTEMFQMIIYLTLIHIISQLVLNLNKRFNVQFGPPLQYAENCGICSFICKISSKSIRFQKLHNFNIN